MPEPPHTVNADEPTRCGLNRRGCAPEFLEEKETVVPRSPMWTPDLELLSEGLVKWLAWVALWTSTRLVP